MKDLVSIMNDENAMIKAGFKMQSDDFQADDKKPKEDKYTPKGISVYTRIISSGNPGYVLGRKI